MYILVKLSWYCVLTLGWGKVLLPGTELRFPNHRLVGNHHPCLRTGFCVGDGNSTRKEHHATLSIISQIACPSSSCMHPCHCCMVTNDSRCEINGVDHA
ncbi:hypothetical protein EDD16DRAFT_1546947 [Pisolithus croceorrhizus]|nr:hypothetical protein EDD16DRAFT_1546947 [Pisolithus croceorrhizus]